MRPSWHGHAFWRPGMLPASHAELQNCPLRLRIGYTKIPSFREMSSEKPNKRRPAGPFLLGGRRGWAGWGGWGVSDSTGLTANALVCPCRQRTSPESPVQDRGKSRFSLRFPEKMLDPPFIRHYVPRRCAWPAGHAGRINQNSPRGRHPCCIVTVRFFRRLQGRFSAQLLGLFGLLCCATPFPLPFDRRGFPLAAQPALPGHRENPECRASPAS